MSFIKRYKNYFSLILISLVTGILGGVIGAGFYHTLHFANSLRNDYPFLMWLLISGGILTVLIYKLLRLEEQGIVKVFSAVKSGERVSLLLFPAVFLCTAMTQLFGGSAGKEGAALQIGGSISSFLVRKFRLQGETASAAMLCGLAAVFSAAFATPLTAIAFTLEIVFISRKFYFKAMPFVTASSLLSFIVARILGVEVMRFDIINMPSLSVTACLKGLAVILVCIGGSIAFCLSVQLFKKAFDSIFKNDYLKITVGAVLIIGLTALVGNGDYNGGGTEVISAVLKTGKTVWFAFLLKILFTAITNAAGFKGGEIVPALFIGAALGAVAGNIIGFNPIFSAALGMITVFGAATKCTAAAFMLSLEFFGITGVGYFAVAALLSRFLSFNIGLYTHEVPQNKKSS